MMTISDNNMNNNSITGSSIVHQTQEPPPPEPEAAATTAVTTAAPVTVTPLSLVVTNLSQHQSGCSAACSHEKRIIRRELQKWAKNVVYLVGFESVAQEFLGPKRWKRMTSGLPCPPASGAKSESRTRGKQGVDNSVEEKEGSGPVISHDVVPGESTTGGPDSESGNKDDGPVEPMDWDPLTTDCLNCALKKAEQEKCLRLVSEVPDSSEVISCKGSDSSPIMKQSSDKMCSCDPPSESCTLCQSPASPSPQINGQSMDHEPMAEDVINSSSTSPPMIIRKKIPSHKIRHPPDQSLDSSQTVQQTNPNYHLLQHLKKQSIFPSISSTTLSSSCDQPLDLSLNSVRVQQLPVASSSSSLLSQSSSSDIAKRSFDQNSLLKVSGSEEAVVAPVTKRVRETTWKRNYTEEELNQALQDIMGGKVGTRRAAVIYGIPRSTLRNKVYKLGKGSPIGPGRLPGRRPKTTAVPGNKPSSSSPSLPTESTSLENELLVKNHVELDADNTIRKEPQVIPKSKTTRKSTKSQNRMQENDKTGSTSSSESWRKLLRDNICNKMSQETDRNNNNDAMGLQSGLGVSGSGSFLNSPALMSMLPLLMLNPSHYASVPDISCPIPDVATNYASSSNLFNQQPVQAAVVGDAQIAQSNQQQQQQQQQALSMLSTLDPAAISAIAPLIYSYLFNFERLVLASQAASAASASLSATATSLSSASPCVNPASGSQVTASSTATTASGPLDFSSNPAPPAPTSDSLLLDYFRLRGPLSLSLSDQTSANPPTVASNDVLTSASGQQSSYQRRETSDDEPEDASVEDDEEESRHEYENNVDAANNSAEQTPLNGSFTDFHELAQTDCHKIDAVSLRSPSIKSKKGTLNNRSVELSGGSGSGTDCEPRSLLERNLLCLPTHRSNSYASSVNSEESNGDQSVTSAGKKGSRGGSASSRRSNGCKTSKDTEVDAAGTKNRPKRGRYRNYDKEALDKAVLAVQSGEMSVHRAGTFYGVPHSTLEYKVKQRHLLREKKRPATSSSNLNAGTTSATMITTTTTAVSSNNSSASSPPEERSPSAANPLPDPLLDSEEPDEKKFCKDSSFESLVVNDL